MGETPILFDVSRSGWNLDKNEEVRCLSYLAQHIEDFVALPPGMEARVIALRYPSLYASQLHPVLSMFVLDGHQVGEQDVPHPFSLEDKIADFLDGTGKEKMLELASTQTLTWEDVLHCHSEVDDPKVS